MTGIFTLQTISELLFLGGIVCSSPLVNVVISRYPAILQNPLLANFIKSNSKIAVREDGQVMCFTKAVVDVRITRAGYSIGACTPVVISASRWAHFLQYLLSGCDNRKKGNR